MEIFIAKCWVVLPIYLCNMMKQMKLLRTINIQNVSVSGDTRFDRVLELASNAQPIDLIDGFCDNKTTIVAGSTWLEDDEELNHFVNTNPDKRFIIAPHDIGEERLKECESLYKNAIRYSQYKAGQFDSNGKNVLLIDNIGMLKFLYRYGTICYVGGGFGGDGVHNVLEAAVYQKPVILDRFTINLLKPQGLFSTRGVFYRRCAGT